MSVYQHGVLLEENVIYLNHAAVAPWPARTTEAVKAFAEENMRLGASRYGEWLKKETYLREQLQTLLNAPSVNDIALLKNTSEALSVVACGLDWKKGDNVVLSAEEFPSNRVPWQAQQSLGVSLKEIDIRVEEPEQALIAACDDNTRVLAISSVQYGSGIRLDLEILGQYCRTHGILFCVDAIQSIGARPMDVQAINADFVMADGHKWMLGPEGLAVFYSTPEARQQLTLRQYGWHMLENTDFDAKEWQPAASARRFECGSPNMLGIHALSASLELLMEIGMNNIERRILTNIAYLFDELGKLDGIRFLTPVQNQRHAGIITFVFDGQELPVLHRKLLENKIICAHRGGGIRFSPHFYTSEESLDKAVKVLSSTI